MSAMTHKQRELAAIRHELPDRVPVDAICIENVPEVAVYLGIRPEEVHDALGIDGRIVAAPYVGAPRFLPDGTPLDDWGAGGAVEYTAHSHRPLATAETVADIESYGWPKPEDYDYAACAAAAAQLGETYATRGPYWMPIVCRVFSLFGVERALEHLALQPAVFDAAARRAFEVTYAYCERMLQACGDALDILCLGDDFATQRGLMISPEHWRRRLRPLYAELFALGKAYGKPVWFHSCGDVTAVLGDLVDIGVDVWETVQLHTLPLSPEELKREFGRDLCFFGGVSTQSLPFAQTDEVRAEASRVIEALGEGGGFICGPDHHIKPDVSAELTVALFAEATGFRKAGWTKC